VFLCMEALVEPLEGAKNARERGRLCEEARFVSFAGALHGRRKRGKGADTSEMNRGGKNDVAYTTSVLQRPAGALWRLPNLRFNTV
jgi:hypothetical protein